MKSENRIESRLARRLRRHISLHDVGSIVGLRTRTKLARRWFDANVSKNVEVWCDPRTVNNILRGFCAHIGEEYPE
jgi:hypothetical protein